MTGIKDSRALEIHGKGKQVEGPDSELISRLRAADDEAFAAIFRRHATRLMRYANRFVKSDAVAQDIVMDVFLRLWRDRLSLPLETRLAPYLGVAVRNSCINHLRHNRVEDEVRGMGTASGWAPGMSVAPLRPDEDLERGEAKEIIRLALEELPPRTRLVLELRWFEGKSYKEIAKELGLQVKSVENSLARAMLLLRQRLRVDRDGR